MCMSSMILISGLISQMLLMVLLMTYQRQIDRCIEELPTENIYLVRMMLNNFKRHSTNESIFAQSYILIFYKSLWVSFLGGHHLNW